MADCWATDTGSLTARRIGRDGRRCIQRHFVKAYQQDEVDADELSTVVKRYDELSEIE